MHLPCMLHTPACHSTETHLETTRSKKAGFEFVEARRNFDGAIPVKWASVLQLRLFLQAAAASDCLASRSEPSSTVSCTC